MSDIAWKSMTDEQRHIAYLEDRVNALYDESERILTIDETLKEISADVKSAARQLEVYVERLKMNLKK